MATVQQFRVPQNIEVEAKIIGPITVRQFIVLLAGGLLAFIFYKIADFTLFLFLSVFDLVITALLAFFKVNGAPLHFFLLNIIQTAKRPSIRVWHHETTRAEIRADMKRPPEEKAMERVVKKFEVGHRTLAQLALIVDTGGAYKGEE